MDASAMRSQVGSKYQTNYFHALVLMDIWTKMAIASAVINCFPAAHHAYRKQNQAKTPFMLDFMTTFTRDSVDVDPPLSSHSTSSKYLFSGLSTS